MTGNIFLIKGCKRIQFSKLVAFSCKLSHSNVFTKKYKGRLLTSDFLCGNENNPTMDLFNDQLLDEEQR